jgi:hypothetical protein
MRLRRQRTALPAAAALAACAALAGCSWGADDLPEVPPPHTAAQALPGQPSTFQGSGDAVRVVRLEPDRPVVVSARAAGQGRFRLRLEAVGTRSEILLIDQPGPVAGRAAFWSGGIGPQGARLVVRAAGRWSFELTQPRPPTDPATLRGEFQGTGLEVIPVRIGAMPVGSISVAYGRREPIFVGLIPYGPATVGMPLFQGRGPVDERAAFVPPGPGSYLLHVRALGRWRIAFGP